MNACCMYDFRQNEEDATEDQIRMILKGIAKKWVFQLEKRKKDGYRHWQGRMSLFEKVRKRGLMQIYRDNNWNIPNYLEPTSKTEHKKGSFNYVMKIPSRIAGPWSDKDEPPFIPKQYKLQKLRKWQESVRNSLTMWDNRKINVIIDEEGNKGKTTCAHYCKLNMGGVVIPAMNDSDKLIQAACCILRGMKQRKSCLMFIDMPRAMNQKNADKCIQQ